MKSVGGNLPAHLGPPAGSPHTCTPPSRVPAHLGLPAGSLHSWIPTQLGPHTAGSLHTWALPCCLEAFTSQHRLVTAPCLPISFWPQTCPRMRPCWVDSPGLCLHGFLLS